jgi:replicative DNA helicase
MAKMMSAAEKANGRRGWLVDSSGGLTASEIVRSVRRSSMLNDTKLVVVDYVQLVRGESMAGKRDKKTRIAEAMVIFAEAAKRDKMAYLVCSQLNRDCENRDNKRPFPSDMSGCGELEEMSKAIIMIYRPHVYGDKYEAGQYEGQERPGQKKGQAIPGSVMEILVRKNNQGLVGTVLADWRPERMRIS